MVIWHCPIFPLKRLSLLRFLYLLLLLWLFLSLLLFLLSIYWTLIWRDVLKWKRRHSFFSWSCSIWILEWGNLSRLWLIYFLLLSRKLLIFLFFTSHYMNIIIRHHFFAKWAFSFRRLLHIRTSWLNWLLHFVSFFWKE